MACPLPRLGQRHLLQFAGQAEQHLVVRNVAACQAVGKLHHRRGVAGRQQGQQLRRQVGIDRAEHLLHSLLADLAGAEGDGLVEQRQAVAHAAAGRLADQRQPAVLVGNLLGLQHVRQVGRHDRRADVAQAELHAARQHRHRHLLRIGGGQHEDDVRRRLLQRLQHGVEGVGGQHVDLVDDEDLVAADGGQIGGVFQHHRHFLDLAVRGRVHLQIIGKPPLVDSATSAAFATGVRADALFAVERLGEDAGDGGLADTASAGQQVGVVQPLVVERMAQRPHDRVLADQRIEITGTPLAGQYLMGGLCLHRVLCRGRARPFRLGTGRRKALPARSRGTP